MTESMRSMIEETLRWAASQIDHESIRNALESIQIPSNPLGINESNPLGAGYAFTPLARLLSLRVRDPEAKLGRTADGRWIIPL